MSDNGNANLTINDLTTITNIIDLATQRGAFRANELVTVGNVYEKVQNFLNQVQAATKAAEETAAKEQTAKGEE